MDAYTINIITGIIRILIFFFVLFVVLPRLLFNRENQTKFPDNMLAGMILVTGFTIVMVCFLTLVRIYDSVSLTFSFVIFSGILVMSGERTKSDVILSKINFHGLRLLEQNILYWLKERFFKKNRSIKGKAEEYSISWNIMLILVLIVSGFERLLPAFQVASPFSMEAYKNLEYVKALETKSLFYDRIFVPKGMHAIIDTVYQFTRVNALTLMHIFGAIFALILVGSIFFIVFRVTGNRPAALVSAAIFGMFPRLLPVSLESQVEANSLLACCIFIVLSVYFLIEYIKNPSFWIFIIIITGAMAATLIDFFAISIFLLLVPVFALAYLFAERKSERNFIRRLISSLIFLLSLVGFYFVDQKFSVNPLVAATIKNMATDYSFMRFAGEEMIFSKEVFFFASVGLGIFNSLLLARMKKDKLQAHYLVWGLATVVLAIFWFGDEMGIELALNKVQMAFVLAIFVSINLGLALYGLIFRFIENSVSEKAVIPLRMTIVSLIVVLFVFEGLLFVNAPAVAKFQYWTEPDGYVRAIYEIERNNDPYQWMVVSHFGTRTQVAGFGRFMDYLYFLKFYSPEKFNFQAKGVIPAKFLYIFTEKDSLNSRVDSAFLPEINDLNKRLNSWCLRFARANKNIKVYYEDSQVRIYQITLPQTNKIISSRTS